MKKGTRSKYRAEFPGDFVFDYKDPLTLQRFLMDGGKIVPSRISKLSHRQQRELNTAVKRARSLALIPCGADAYDTFFRPEQISPKPVEL